MSFRRAALLLALLLAACDRDEAGPQPLPWDAARGVTLCLAFAGPDGRLVTSGLDGVVRLFAPDGKTERLLGRHLDSVSRLAVAPRGFPPLLVTVSADEDARLFDLGANREIARLLGHKREVVEARFAGTAEQPVVATLSLDGTVILWSAEGERTKHLRDRHDIEGLETSPAGDRIVLLVPDGTARLVTAAGDDVATLDDEAARGADRAWFSPDGSRLALRGPGNTVALYDADGGLVARLDGHVAPVVDIAFSPDGALVATASLDQTARLFDAKAGRAMAVLAGPEMPLHRVVFAPDAKSVVTLGLDRAARRYDLGGRLLATMGGATDPVADVRFAPDGSFLLALPFEHGGPALYTPDGRLLCRIPDESGHTIAARLSADGKRLALLDQDLAPRVVLLDRSPAGPAPAPPPRPPAREAPPHRGEFAGTVWCARCHKQAYEAWHESSHARTSYFPTAADMPAEVLEGGVASHPPGRTRFEAEGDRWFADVVAEDGEVHRYPISMVAGHLRVRFFVTRLDDGRLQVLPPMYELPTDSWFDYTALIFGAPTKDWMTPPVVNPGDGSFWTGPERSWDARCAVCHMSGRTWRDPGPTDRGPRSVWRAYAVDCEACHGPGRKHAEAWERLEMDRAMPRLEELPLARRTATCTRCHQEGEVLDPPWTAEKDLYDYKDPSLIVDPERVDATGRALELVYDGLPLATSQCARKGGLTCSTCHAPHGSGVRSLLRHAPEDGSFCVKCHPEHVEEAGLHSHHDPGREGGQCVPCHMPFLTIERGHGAVADHTIGIPRLGLRSDRMTTDACTWCHQGGYDAPDDVPRLDDGQIEKAYESWWPARTWPRPWMGRIAAARRGDDDAWKGLLLGVDDETAPREARATAALLLGRYVGKARAEVLGTILRASEDPDSLIRRSAVRALAGARGDEVDARLRSALDDPSWAVRRAAAQTALDGYERVKANRALLDAIVPVLLEDAERVPDDDLRWFRVGAAADLRDDAEGALRAYEHVARLNPLNHEVARYVETLRARTRAAGR